MIFRAVVCPGAPLLIPGLAEELSALVPELVEACDRAVGRLRPVDRVLLLCSGPRVRDDGRRALQVPVVHPAGTLLSSAMLTGSSRPAHFTGRLAGPAAADGRVGVSPDPAVLPGVGVVVAAALLARAGIEKPAMAVELGDRTDGVAAVLGEAETSAERVGLLVVAEGSASRGSESPGGGAADDGGLDASLAAALADGDPAALRRAATIDRATAASLVFTSGPALLAMADLTESRPPQQAELLLDQAPLGVGYLVAAWSWEN